MEALYDYLTSPQFAHKLKAVYGDLPENARRAGIGALGHDAALGPPREKQLQSGIAELLGVAGDIQGLAQQELPALELESPPP